MPSLTLPPEEFRKKIESRRLDDLVRMNATYTEMRDHEIFEEHTPEERKNMEACWPVLKEVIAEKSKK